ncbi:hypothetical protein [Desulfotomaculum copahuensis]|uniref:DUF155 domain-containing protein n=1 Tax=Desulfotomaculum copahuensis TaxID=1838280 RepID=A0A1B7LDK9_9FIRM|nr:hypothetical protein [Desulfotomaculum copahuensis]OAT81193.1 hypothetical protein A6M21_11705 [Desulfotomaculum copahuensis]
MSNSILLYRLFDVAEEISLEQVEQILSRRRPTSRLRLAIARPRAVHIPNPPVTVELGDEQVSLAGRNFTVNFTGKVYDLGVISLLMQVSLPPETGYDQIRSLAIYLNDSGSCAGIFQDRLCRIQKELAGTMKHPGVQGFEEDYTIFYFQDWQPDWDPVPLLLAEAQPVSEQVRRETLRHSFSYGPDDLAIITWASALVYDAAGSYDIPDLLEFAATQLLELRYYDSLLSDEMARMYDAIEDAETVTRFRRLNQYRHIMNRLMELVVDVNEITERIQNSLKVTEDVFYARVYGAALTVFRTRAWMESIERKLSVVLQNYTMLSNRMVNQQSTVLELAIVALFLLEILLSLPNLLR